MIFVVVVFIIFILAGSLVMLFFANRSPSIHKKKENLTKIEEKSSKPTFRNISELVKIEELDQGVLYVNGKYLGIARLDGTNFSVLSDGEQDVREDVLINIQNRIDFPVQYVTSTIVTDTEVPAKKIRDRAIEIKNPNLANYMNMYALALEEMKNQRKAMSQVSWMVISDDGEKGDPINQIREKMSLLRESLRAHAGIVLTPLVSNEDVVDALQQIMLPERLSRPSELTSVGALSPIKFNIREIENLT